VHIGEITIGGQVAGRAGLCAVGDRDRVGVGRRYGTLRNVR
jgi:hypothetical protein